MVTIAMWFCGLSSVTSISSMLYAFSRDNGLPFKNSKVSAKFRTPAYAILLSVFLAFLCALADNVYAVVTSLSVIGLYTSYGIPIFLKLRAQLRGYWTEADNGPWTLGNWSKPVSFISVLWIVFVTVLFNIFSSDVAITKHFTLTYATGKVFACVAILLIIYYTHQARHTFKGPNLGAYRAVHERITAKKLPAEPEGEENVIL